jgi:hypothetical protein
MVQNGVRQRFNLTQAFKGGFGGIEDPPIAQFIDLDFVLGTHDRLEKIVIQPQGGIQAAQDEQLLQAVQPSVTDIGAHQTVIVLLHEAVIIFVIRTRTRDC